MRPIAKYWDIPTIWSGDCFIIGGGPSVLACDMDKLRDRHVIGCNDAYKNFPHLVDFNVFRDTAWHEAHKRYFSDFSGLFVTVDHIKRVAEPSRQMKICKMTNNFVSIENWQLNWYRNAGIMAIELAAKLGADRILLLGFDCCVQNGRANWYDSIKPNEPPVKRKARRIAEFPDAFKRFAVDFRRVFPEVRVVNLNPESKLDVFEKQEFDKVVR